MSASPRDGPPLHGWIVVDKPVGPGSTDVVSAVKRALREGGYAKVKVGHGGTLDPLASGVLPVALGEATKLAGRMLDADKLYAFTIRFGVETDTLDAEGKVVAVSDVLPSPAEIEAVLPRFTGAIDQLPPAFSALKVEGRRAYDLARAGEAVTLATRAVTVHSLRVTADSRVATLAPAPAPVPTLDSAPIPFPVSAPPRHRRERGDLVRPGAWLVEGDPRFRGNDGTQGNEATLLAHVSKGTYIRSLARDVANALGTVGHVTMLRRLKAGPFDLSHAISLDNLARLGQERALEQVMLPLGAGLDGIPALPLTPDQAVALRQGRTLTGPAAAPGLHLAMLGTVPVALVERNGADIRVVRGFNPMP